MSEIPNQIFYRMKVLCGLNVESLSPQGSGEMQGWNLICTIYKHANSGQCWLKLGSESIHLSLLRACVHQWDFQYLVSFSCTTPSSSLLLSHHSAYSNPYLTHLSSLDLNVIASRLGPPCPGEVTPWTDLPVAFAAGCAITFACYASHYPQALWEQGLGLFHSL